MRKRNSDLVSGPLPSIVRAYEKLGVKHEDVRALPQITPQLGMVMAKLRRRRYPCSPYYYLSCSDSPDARRLLDAYHSVGKTVQSRLPIEAFCAAASIPPHRVLDIINSIIVQLSQRSSAMLAAATHPEVVERTIDIALGPDDKSALAAATVLHKAVGFLPTPKSSQTSIHIIQQAQASSGATAAIADAPSPEQTIRRFVNRMRPLPNSAAPVLAASPAPIVELMEGEEIESKDD